MRIVFGLFLFFSGVIVIFLNKFGVQLFPDQLEFLVDISGTLISSVCAFPIKEIVDRKNKIKLIRLLFNQFENSSGQDKKKLEELIWKFIEKNTID